MASIWRSLFHLYAEKMDHMGKNPGLIKDRSAPTDQSISSTARHWLGVSEAWGGAYPGADQTPSADTNQIQTISHQTFTPTDNTYACSAHFKVLHHAITARL